MQSQNTSEQQFNPGEASLLSGNSDHVKTAKEKELSQWKAEKSYAEEIDHRYESIFLRWVVTPKVIYDIPYVKPQLCPQGFKET